MAITRVSQFISALLLLTSWANNWLPSSLGQPGSHSGSGGGLRVVLRSEQGRYSVGERVKLEVFVRNDNGPSIYVDRRMYWGGVASGLAISATDQQGNPVRGRLFADALMPTPNPDDKTPFVRLDSGYFYGISLNAHTADFLPGPGTYLLRVV